MSSASQQTDLILVDRKWLALSPMLQAAMRSILLSLACAGNRRSELLSTIDGGQSLVRDRQVPAADKAEVRSVAQPEAPDMAAGLGPGPYLRENGPLLDGLLARGWVPVPGHRQGMVTIWRG